MDGTVNFYRGWNQYKNGFGHAAGEYWLGKLDSSIIFNGDNERNVLTALTFDFPMCIQIHRSGIT